jgi:RimJ/RimL family protein N-acetyltransferase
MFLIVVIFLLILWVVYLVSITNGAHEYIDESAELKSFVDSEVPELLAEDLVIKSTNYEVGDMPDIVSDYNHMISLTPEVYAKKIEPKPNVKYFVGYKEGIPVCAISLDYTDWDYDYPILEIRSSLTHPEHRRRGYNTQLLTSIINYIKSNTAISRLYAQVLKWNEANMSLLEKLGFQVYGQRKSTTNKLVLYIPRD